ncbi:MAG: OB-fold nucleic acid binding domain-containing protein [bacterium]
MQKIFVRELQEGSNVDSVFLCAHKVLLFGKNNKAYLNMKLLDKTGQIEARVWERAELLGQNFEKSDYVRAKGKVVFYQDHLQFNVFEIEKVADSQVNPADFLPTSKQDIPRMYQELLQICREDMKNPWVRQLMLGILEDPQYREAFQRAPAAKTNHHAWVGGLLEHILGLCKLAKAVLSFYPMINLDLVLAGLIMHDFGKIEEIESERSFEYTDKGRLIGHLIISIEILVRKAAEIPGFPEKILHHLEHIVLSHHGRLEYGSPKRPKTLEALVVHHLDDMDSKIQGFLDLVAREGENDSTWTSHNNRLFERPLYKKTREDLEGPVEPEAPKQDRREKTQARPAPALAMNNLGEILQASLQNKKI